MGNKTHNDTNPKIVQLCLNTICPYLQGDGKFTKDEVSDITYCLTDTSGNHFTGISSHGKTVPILKMLNGFFIHCSMVFKEVQRKKVLKGISLQFYDEHNLLFRAEWDNRDFLKSEKTIHSQPHWHLEAKSDLKKSQVPNTFLEYQALSRFKDDDLNTTQDSSKQIKLGRLHFFMAFERNTTQKIYYIDLTDDKLLQQWLSQCLYSINEELTFVNIKK